MSWINSFAKSSIGKKLVMSLTGLFLIIFLIVHLIGNLQLLKGDGGDAFNTYAYFMTHNPLIKTVSYGLYFFILLHTFQGLYIWWCNRQTKGQTYEAGYKNPKVDWASQNMALLGTLILVFLIIHMGDFWFKMKFTDQLDVIKLPNNEHEMKDLYKSCALAFSELWYVVLYVIAMIVLYFHLSHGFASAFQTIGWNHPKYTPIIKFIGKAYAILVPIGFAVIPIIFYYSTLNK
jgi:succinate dehydrogenase / fumarate reductase, cytochrome b subunit